MTEFVVKSEEQGLDEDRDFTAWQDGHLSAIGLSRSDFPCFEGVQPEDEHVIVWALDEAAFQHEPRNLVKGGWNPTTGHWEYTFLPVIDEWSGTPAVVGY